MAAPAQPASFNRWLIPPAAIAIHLSVGSVYAWSVFNKPIEAVCPDFPKDSAAYTFSIAMLLLGLSAAFSGTWIERQGPRRAATLASVLFGGGLLLGGVAVAYHQLWLLFLGYGVIGGVGLGLAYISPVSALVKWFPDRRGMATGLAVLGFGGGALIASPLKAWLIVSIGVDRTMYLLGVVYFGVMFLGARVLRRPAPDWRPAGWSPTARQRDHQSGNEYSLSRAVKTRQFWLLWTVLFINVTAGISILSQGSPMMQDIFGRTPSEAAAMLSVISLFNAGGRFFWAWLSDFVGRRVVFLTFFLSEMVLFALIPTLGASRQWLGFQLVTLVIFSMYGGGFATIPAYLADLFGARYVGAVHGMILTAWSAAGVAGPLIITQLRRSKLSALPETLSKAHVYDQTMYLMSGLLLVGLLATLLIRPVRETA